MLQDTTTACADSSQLQRLQERIERQLASTRREITDSVEQVAQRHAQESMELLRSQVQANQSVLQKDISFLQTGVGELRLHVVAANQEGEEQRRLLNSNQEAWESAVEEVREQLRLLRAEFTESLESAQRRMRDHHAAEVAANSATAASAASLREELQKVAMRAESVREAGEQAAGEMLHGLRAQAAEMVRDRGHWTAQLADVKEACFGQLDDLKRSLDIQLEEAKLSAHARASESKFTASLISETKESLVAHLDAQISGVKEAVDTVADSMNKCKNDLDLHKQSLDAMVVSSREEFAGIVEGIRKATDEKVDRIQAVTEEREQKGEEMTRLLKEDVAKGYQAVQSEARGEGKAEAESLRKWMEAGLEAQNAHWRSAVLMLEQRQRELQDGYCELQTRTCKTHEELTSDLGGGLARLACETHECERRLQDVAREKHHFERHLQETSAEAAHQAKQLADALNRVQSESYLRYAEVMRSQDQVQSLNEKCNAEQKSEWRQLTAALQHVEERTAWLCGRADSAHDVALSDIQACVARQETAQAHSQELQQHLLALQDVQSVLQRRQQVLEDTHCEQQQHVATRVKVLAQDLEALRDAATAQERLTARVAAATEREDASLAASVNAAEERQIAKQEVLKRYLEEQMSKLAAELRESASSNHTAHDDALQKLRQTHDDAVRQLRQTHDDSRQTHHEAIEQLTNRLAQHQGEQQVVQEQLQNTHGDAAQQLRQSLKDCEEEQQRMQQLHADAMQQVQQSLRSCEQEQHSVYEQVQHDFADMAEHLMHFRSSICDTHETAEQSVQRCAQLMRGHSEFTQELGRAQVQHRELRKEQQSAVAQLATELRASEAQTLTDQRLILAQVHEIGKTQEAQEMRVQRCSKRCQVRHTESGEALEEVRKEMEERRKHLLGDILSEQTALAHSLQRQVYDAERAAVAKGEHSCEASAQAMSERLRKELGLLRHIHDERAKQLQDRIDLVSQKAQETIMHQVADASVASAALRLKADEHAASITEVREMQRAERLVSSQGHAEAIAEIGACREACFLATQRAAAEQAVTERNCLDKAEAMQAETLARVRVLSEQLLEQSASQEPRFIQLGEAVARLEEDGGPNSRIAGAAAAAASKVRDEVFQEVTHLREKVRDEVFQEVIHLSERFDAIDDQMIFLRGEVAPDVLRGFLQPSVVQYSERAAADQLSRFKKEWGRDVEWRLDCMAECLNSLYLKLGLPTRGAFAALRQDAFPT